MAETYRIGDAAALLGVRVETIRRWERAGKIELRRTSGRQRVVPAAEVARLLAAKRERPAPVAAGSARNRFSGVITAIRKDDIVATVEILAGPHRILASRRRRAAPVAAGSARNRFEGVVTAVTKDRVVATVEILAGPHRVVALTTREAVDELGLRPGVEAVAVVKAPNVVVELPA